MKTITIQYGCALCGITEAEVEVPVRHDGDSVVQWMKDVTVFLVEDHQKRSPGCHPQSLKDVKIPVAEGARWIGDAP